MENATYNIFMYNDQSIFKRQKKNIKKKKIQKEKAKINYYANYYFLNKT